MNRERGTRRRFDASSSTSFGREDVFLRRADPIEDVIRRRGFDRSGAGREAFLMRLT
ncbi:MAG TPA: hypothetical protein VGD80_20830 [Kofleriaceae bacterium]